MAEEETSCCWRRRRRRPLVRLVELKLKLELSHHERVPSFHARLLLSLLLLAFLTFGSLAWPLSAHFRPLLPDSNQLKTSVSSTSASGWMASASASQSQVQTARVWRSRAVALWQPASRLHRSWVAGEQVFASAPASGGQVSSPDDFLTPPRASKPNTDDARPPMTLGLGDNDVDDADADENTNTSNNNGAEESDNNNNNNNDNRNELDRPEVALLATDDGQRQAAREDEESNGPTNNQQPNGAEFRPSSSSPDLDLSANYSNASTNGTICDQMGSIMHSNTSSLLSLVYYVCYGLLFVLGLAGNSLTIWAMSKKREKTVTDMFIVSLALSDVMVCIFAIPITPTYLLYYQTWVFGLTLCRVFTFAMSSSVYISTFTMIAIALVRYQLVVYPHRNWGSTLAVTSITISIWSLGILMTLPYLMHVDLVPTEDCPIKFCNEKWNDQSHRIRFSWLTLICQFLLPFITVSFLYFAVYRKLRDRQQLHNRQQVARRLQQANKLNHTAQAGQKGAKRKPKRLYLHHRSAVSVTMQQQQPRNNQANSAQSCGIELELGSLNQLHSDYANQPSCLNLGLSLGLGQAPVTGGARASSAEELAVQPTMTSGATTNLEKRNEGAAYETIEPRLSSASVNVVNERAGNETSTCLLADYSLDDDLNDSNNSNDSHDSNDLNDLDDLNELNGAKRRTMAKAPIPGDSSAPQQRRRPASSMGFLNRNHTDDDELIAEAKRTARLEREEFAIEQDGQTDLAAAVATTCASARGQNKQRLEQVSQRADDILAIRDRRINERNRRLNQTNRKLVFMVSLFACSWLPLNVFNLVQDYMESLSESPYIKHIFLTVHLIACSSVCYNPILYAWMSDNYRQELRNILPGPLLRKLNFLIGAH